MVYIYLFYESHDGAHNVVLRAASTAWRRRLLEGLPTRVVKETRPLESSRYRSFFARRWSLLVIPIAIWRTSGGQIRRYIYVWWALAIRIRAATVLRGTIYVRGVRLSVIWIIRMIVMYGCPWWLIVSCRGALTPSTTGRGAKLTSIPMSAFIIAPATKVRPIELSSRASRSIW